MSETLIKTKTNIFQTPTNSNLLSLSLNCNFNKLGLLVYSVRKKTKHYIFMSTQQLFSDIYYKKELKRVDYQGIV